MKDRGGRIKVPGFYDDVRELKEEERAEWKRLPFNETRYRKELGAPRLFGESGYSTLERVWARPTFEVNGLLAGSPATAQRPSSRPPRWRRSACGWCPISCPTRSRSSSRRT